jgi:tRNA-dihydrouridine synthase
LITVHGRTREQNKDRVGCCNWKMIKKIKQYVNIPVIANGGIYTFKDVERCLEETGADGVMSAEALLENPALFSGKMYCLDSLAEEYLDLTEEYDGASVSCIRAHLFKMLFKGLNENVDLRERMAKAITMDEFRSIVAELKNRRIELGLESKFGWYQRYWNKFYIKPEYPIIIGNPL